jgi:hypothetical protein
MPSPFGKVTVLRRPRLEHRGLQLRRRETRQSRGTGMLLVLAHRQVVAVEAPVLLAREPGGSPQRRVRGILTYFKQLGAPL